MTGWRRAINEHLAIVSPVPRSRLCHALAGVEQKKKGLEERGAKLGLLTVPLGRVHGGGRPELSEGYLVSCASPFLLLITLHSSHRRCRSFEGTGVFFVPFMSLCVCVCSSYLIGHSLHYQQHRYRASCKYADSRFLSFEVKNLRHSTPLDCGRTP